MALEAGFYLGLARFNNAKYAEAASAFAFVASRLPLPEVVNDQGVAASRQGKDATPLFEQVASPPTPAIPTITSTSPSPFCAAATSPAATHEVETALKLHSVDPEAAQLLARLQSTHGSTANLKAVISAGGFDPTTRIRRTWSEASFRQAAFQLDQIRAVRVAMLAAGRAGRPIRATRARTILRKACCRKPSRSSRARSPPTQNQPPRTPASRWSANAATHPTTPAPRRRPP